MSASSPLWFSRTYRAGRSEARQLHPMLGCLNAHSVRIADTVYALPGEVLLVGIDCNGTDDKKVGELRITMEYRQGGFTPLGWKGLAAPLADFLGVLGVES